MTSRYRNINPTEYSISTMTCTVYSNIEKIDILKMVDLYKSGDIFNGAPVTINEKKKFKNCAIIKIHFDCDKKRTVAINVFNTGNFHVTGSRSNDEIESTLTYVCEELYNNKIIDICDIDYKIEIRLINSNFCIPLYNVDLNKLYEVIKKDKPDMFSKYDANNHPGVQIKVSVSNVNVSCFIFGSAKIIITGSRNIEQLNNVYDFITSYIDEKFSLVCKVKPPVVEKIPQKRGRKRLVR